MFNEGSIHFYIGGLRNSGCQRPLAMRGTLQDDGPVGSVSVPAVSALLFIPFIHFGVCPILIVFTEPVGRQCPLGFRHVLNAQHCLPRVDTCVSGVLIRASPDGTSAREASAKSTFIALAAKPRHIFRFRACSVRSGHLLPFVRPQNHGQVSGIGGGERAQAIVKPY
jgi:hypothetical protein